VKSARSLGGGQLDHRRGLLRDEAIERRRYGVNNPGMWIRERLHAWRRSNESDTHESPAFSHQCARILVRPGSRRAYSRAAGPVVLDLTDLTSADAIALDALRRLRADGVELFRLPPYLGLTLGDNHPSWSR